MISISVNINGRTHSVKAASMRLATNKMAVKIDEIINKAREDLVFAEQYKEALNNVMQALPEDPPEVLAAEAAMQDRRRGHGRFDMAPPEWDPVEFGEDIRVDEMAGIGDA